MAMHHIDPIDVEVVEVKEGNAMEEQKKQAEVDFVGLEVFEEAMVSAKQKLFKLVQEGKISDQTAGRLVAEYELSFFQQLVRVQLA